MPRSSRVLAFRIRLPAVFDRGIIDVIVQSLEAHTGIKISIEAASPNEEGARRLSVLAKAGDDVELLRLAARINAADWRGTGATIEH